ncbi:Hydroxyethylthiazole kinase family-domain-containing protein [Amylocarpus encephaloides]|uniref:Hydroxyethylthiazole kinase family-domain-containing protein n=1 Tax=Amylocarpus encephaloides TaxID=45428 RepID=A0A9P7Y8R7_9HELO|nr:Hydroxyethylthiazole kinase family-domain-containing protein [Amylocarpus encephaloides]
MAYQDPKYVDFSLYLVTDSTSAILRDRDLVEVVEAAIEGGVTIVQYRDKVSDTAALVSTAKKLHNVTRKHQVPLLINDRIDVALAVGCEGVHIGQDDLDLTSARRLLGKEAIIGVTVTTIAEAQKACKDGANYLGIGTVFATPTKTNTKDIIGTAGTKEILAAIAKEGSHVATVCIGGINASNVQRVMYQSSSPEKGLDGVAIVSAIVAAKDPKHASQELLKLVKGNPPFNTAPPNMDLRRNLSASSHVERSAQVVREAAEVSPLSHNMTNLVVQNFAANVALAVGGSPIMANYGEEAADLAKLGGSLVINMGTVTPEGLINYAKAMRAYNLVGGPIVFDPVGGGATAVRRDAVKSLLAAGYFDVIKGNEGEIKTVFGTVVQQKGVDSGASTSTDEEKATLVRDLARRECNVVVMTGATDFLSDGQRTFAVNNGHELLGAITGSGCVLGTAISIMLAAWKEDRLLATLAGLLHFEIAAEIAAERDDVKGPGSFVPALIDEIYNIQKSALKRESDWLKRANVDFVDLE